MYESRSLALAKVNISGRNILGHAFRVTGHFSQHILALHTASVFHS